MSLSLNWQRNLSWSKFPSSPFFFWAAISAQMCIAAITESDQKIPLGVAAVFLLGYGLMAKMMWDVVEDARWAVAAAWAFLAAYATSAAVSTVLPALGTILGGVGILTLVRMALAVARSKR